MMDPLCMDCRASSSISGCTKHSGAGRPVETRRPIVTIHLPVALSCAAKVLQVVAKEYPGAVVDQSHGDWVVTLPEPMLVPRVYEERT